MSVSQKEDIHEDIIWGEDTCGPLRFEAPLSWKSVIEENSNLYYPTNEDGYSIGYNFKVRFVEDGEVDDYLDHISEEYEDVDIYDLDMEEGYKGYRVDYYYRLGETKQLITAYAIQIYPDSGVLLVLYEAPEADSSVYEEEFNRLFDSLYIVKEEKEEEEAEEYGHPYPYVYADEDEYEYEYEEDDSNYYAGGYGGYYILNESTGKFHEPTCYKVPEIINSVEMYDSYAEMFANGYEPCGICNPR